MSSNFANVLSAVQQRVIDRLSGRFTTSTDIVMEPTAHEAEQYGNISSMADAQQSFSGLFSTLPSQPIYTPPSYVTQPSILETGLGTNTSVSYMGQPMAATYWYSSFPQYAPLSWEELGNAPEAPLKPSVEVVDAPSREMLKRMPVDVEILDLTNERQKLATEAEDLLGYIPLRKELHVSSKLQRVLAKLEISTLEEKGVFAYKKQMAQHYSTTNKMADPTWRITPLDEYTQAVPEFVLHKAVEIKRELPEAMFYVEQLAIDPFLIVTLTPLQDFMSTWNTLRRSYDPEMTAYIEVWSEPKFEATM